MTSSHKPDATFLVRFEGAGISPEKIPLRAVTDALAAVQDIANARDPFDKAKIPPEKAIRLLNVERGSAIYGCIAKSPDEARHNLTRLGSILAQSANNDADSDILVAALHSIAALSAVARTTGCRIAIDLINGSHKHAFAISEGDYNELSSKLLLKGDTTVIGKVERAGGATRMKCMLRIHGRRKALYCDVASRALARRLGHHLYENIVATGTATWIHRSWRLYKFTVRDFAQPRLNDGHRDIEELRRAGLDAWDGVTDPAAVIEEMRGEDSGT